jgi:hypothetical protein
MNVSDFHVGDTVFLMQELCGAKIELRYCVCKITKVGRKYLYVDAPYTYAQRFELDHVRYDRYLWSNNGYTTRLYASKDQVFEDFNASIAYRQLKKVFNDSSPATFGFTYDALKRVAEILQIELPEEVKFNG